MPDCDKKNYLLFFYVVLIPNIPYENLHSLSIIASEICGAFGKLGDAICPTAPKITAFEKKSFPVSPSPKFKHLREIWSRL
jgi:hypothetical protein